MTSDRCSPPLLAGSADSSVHAACGSPRSPGASTAAACPLTASGPSAAQAPAAQQPALHILHLTLSSTGFTPKVVGLWLETGNG